MSKDPTRQQLSSRLAYNAHTPAFLLRMQQRVSGARGADDDEDDEYEYDGSGRPPIPKRPAIPERPSNDLGSADEDDADERPQVVVLKEGKHLSEREVEDERRKAKGLPPLPNSGAQGDEAQTSASGSKMAEKPANAAKQVQGLSFSSGAAPRAKSTKRKAVGDGRDPEAKDGKGGKSPKKKHKKAEKKLLSFGDEA
ncbi:uncharacterized protein LAESUDRAFT_661652 [Laetiporus sulphureus 93-53]|uniref:DUF4604 domain-containing protein n=1 Tax=Laetiporus sulphureus 93-53 TaxID=1314785 RepID=A0A165CDG4_9APHY|nr:uncharacterized protein LAESUDRAFT_661652 [Laetiporus sulphureus 93-53]KZT02612.1 hypothetical protein LAESUDRAFT_661652 [Laetiporus sulphureus 93-53]